MRKQYQEQEESLFGFGFTLERLEAGDVDENDCKNVLGLIQSLNSHNPFTKSTTDAIYEDFTYKIPFGKKTKNEYNDISTVNY